MAGALQGKKGLVVGVANDKSIAWGCARALRDAGAELALTWFNDKARPHVEPLAQQLQAPITLPLDVEQAGQMEAVFAAIAQRWGQLDFVLHSIAFAPKSDLHGRVVDSSREGFARAMDISCHSFARMAHLNLDTFSIHTHGCSDCHFYGSSVRNTIFDLTSNA